MGLLYSFHFLVCSLLNNLIQYSFDSFGIRWFLLEKLSSIFQQIINNHQIIIITMTYDCAFLEFLQLNQQLNLHKKGKLI
jgi:hypothetical protein